jgi:prophage antirepressor-like protein
MNDNIKIFNNEKFGEIKTAKDDNGNPLFCLNDVCWALEVAPIEVKRRLDSDMVLARSVVIDDVRELINFISEEGLYRAVTDKPDDKEFLEWITSEVLPSIRKNDSCDQVIDETKTVEYNKENNMEKTVRTGGIQIFNNPQFGEIRIAMNEQGEPLFCLKDLCDALNLSNNRKVASQLDDDVTLSYPIVDSLGRTQKATFVTEPGMYTVILRSDSPKAKPMQKWVTSDVLPSIRKHGGYLTPIKTEELLMNPDLIIQLATSLKTEREEKERLRLTNEAQQKQLALQAPKVALMEKILDDDQKIDVGQAAKILNLPFGRNTLFKKLREKGVIFKNRNEPKQEYIKKGYFKMKESWIETNRYDGVVSIKILVTQKGLEFIAQLFGVISSENNNNININN